MTWGSNAHAVDDSVDFRRVRDLPRRARTADTVLVDQLDSVLRLPSGQMHLRPVQALALHDIGTCGGLLAPIPVGGGKTLVSLLAPYVLEARRPLLLLPAALVQKTEVERRRLMDHWRIPRNIRLASYQSLGRVDGARMLELYRPDVIIADEAHRLKNPRAACTRRVVRYMHENPGTKFIAMSGTIIKHSLRDFGKMCGWALKDGAPVPLDENVLDQWADSLDEKVNPLRRVKTGVLGHDLPGARAWFKDRLLDTAGVVAATTDGPDCSLRIAAVEYEVNQQTEDNFRKLRTEWCTPDGWALSQATDVWRHARELALGLHYIWSPRPPEEWLEARRCWAKFVRETIKNTMHAGSPLDSELQVVQAVDKGAVDDGGLLRAWRLIKPTFQVNSKPVWHDDSALIQCEKWMKDEPGIVWCEHIFFATELHRRSGAEYYAAGGCDSKGRSIESADGKRSIIASVAANGTGRNLQMFSRSLITSMSPGADILEQLIGRTHRPGQCADEVTVDILLSCAEHEDAFQKARLDAKMYEQTLGQPQKLLYADVTWPPPHLPTKPRWTRSTSSS